MNEVEQLHIATLKDVIAAQQDVIAAWESVFNAAESSILNLVKTTIELKLQIIRYNNPHIVVPPYVYTEMDNLRDNYYTGRISPIEYFEGLNILLTKLV